METGIRDHGLASRCGCCHWTVTASRLSQPTAHRCARQCAHTPVTTRSAEQELARALPAGPWSRARPTLSLPATFHVTVRHLAPTNRSSTAHTPVASEPLARTPPTPPCRAEGRPHGRSLGSAFSLSDPIWEDATHAACHPGTPALPSDILKFVCTKAQCLCRKA